MLLYGPSKTSKPSTAAMITLEGQLRRKERLMSFLKDGLPTLPSYAFELNTLLSSPSVDLRRVAKVIRNDPSMSAQVIRLCNSALFSLRRRVVSIEEAAVLMGSERLRTLVLTCSVMEFTGRQLPRGVVQAFWQHSFMSGLLSERIAKWIEYSEREQAYLGGLLHDIGVLPLLMIAAEENTLKGDTISGPWGGSVEAEKAQFGLTHCEVGRWIGQSWNFFPSFIDVFENHHSPERSVRDPHLVGIVAAADRFCERHSMAPPSEGEGQEIPETEPALGDEFLTTCLPRLDAKDCAELTEMLETEYLHLVPVIEFNNSTELRMAGKSA
jgi:HD-like signal output (HDOD) protein